MTDDGRAAPRFRVLGPLAVADGRAPEQPAPRRLLAILLLRPGRTWRPEGLADHLWGERQPATAHNVLQVHLSTLRRTVGADLVERRPGGYRLAVDEHDVDAGRFTALAVAAQRDRGGDPVARVELADRALALWTGSPYEDLDEDVFARPEVVRLAELHHQVRELRLRGLHAAGRSREAIAELEALVLEHPHREGLWRLLALVRHDLERRAEALAALADARSALADVGLDPGPRLRQLELHLLRSACGGHHRDCLAS